MNIITRRRRRGVMSQGDMGATSQIPVLRSIFWLVSEVSNSELERIWKWLWPILRYNIATMVLRKTLRNSE
jgi:hypothetical protein